MDVQVKQGLALIITDPLVQGSVENRFFELLSSEVVGIESFFCFFYCLFPFPDNEGDRLSHHLFYRLSQHEHNRSNPHFSKVGFDLSAGGLPPAIQVGSVRTCEEDGAAEACLRGLPLRIAM